MRSALILAAVLNGLVANAFAQSTTSALSDLPSSVRDNISRTCLPVQYREGAEAYRSCVLTEMANSQSRLPTSELINAYDNLTFDEQYAIQQACESTGNVSQCQSSQVANMLAVPKPDLSSLTSDEQYVMQQTCFGAQSNAGAAAYRQCLLNEVRSVESLPAPDFSALSAVARNSLQINCSTSEAKLTGYRSCLLEGTADLSQPVVTAASVVAESAVATSQFDDGANAAVPTPVAVRIQTNDSSAGQTISTRPRLIKPPTTPAAQGLTQPKPELAAALPAASTQRPAAIALKSLNVESGETDSPNAQTSTASDTTQSENNTTENMSVESITNNANQNSNLDSANETATDTAADVGTSSAENDGSNNGEIGAEGTLLEQLKARLSEYLSNSMAWLNDLSQQGKMLLGALILMPLALWALLAGRRRRDYDDDYDYEDDSYPARAELKQRVRAHGREEGTPVGDHDQHDPLAANWEAEADSLFDEPPTVRTESLSHSRKNALASAALASESESVTTQRYDNTAYANGRDEPRSNSEHGDYETPVAPTSATNTRTGYTPSGFAGWLHSQPAETRQSLAIEFLMYWMAYGDERFEPSLKQKIFQLSEPSTHDIVKRWVLKQDVYAFADTVDWLQRHTTQLQKEQIVRFLMVLLINGDTPTPVQNTLLRFFGDVFYLSNPGVEEMFDVEYDVELPPMPRADRMAWWDRQTPGIVALWDARSLNASDELTRYAAQLGVDGNARTEQVEAAYERAMMRCNDMRFDQLDEQEHKLLASRQVRLTQARDELLEALA